MPPPAPPISLDATRLLADLVAARVLDAGRADAVWADFRAEHPSSEPGVLADFLVEQGLLTPFQAERAAAGETDSLLLGPYLLIEPHGGGTFGTVYTALSRTDRERYAVRVLPLRSLWKVLAAKRVLLASATAAHPTVVPFADVDSAAGRHYLAWPYVEGETLEHSVRRVGPLSPADAARLFADLADGLAALHAAGIHHGLIRPAAVLLGFDRRPRLLDLGLGAILAENLADEQSMLDTVSVAATFAEVLDCTAPEVLLDPAVRTPAADAYAVGCTLYFALTGLPPFPDPSAAQKVLGHQSRQPVPVRTRNPQVPVALAALVEEFMRKDPRDRTTNFAQVRDRLRAAVSLPDPPPADHTPPSAAGSGAGMSDSNDARHYQIPKRAALADHSGVVSFELRESAEHPTPAPVETPPEVQSGTFPLSVVPPPSAIHLSVSVPSSRLKRDVTAPPPAPPESKLGGLPAPVAIESGRSKEFVLPPVAVPGPPRFAGSGNSFLRSLMFWKPPADAVLLSVFGPPRIAPGQKVQFLVYAHRPEAFVGVSTLCRALHAEADLLGVGYLDRRVPRKSEVGLHLALANAGVAKSLLPFTWTGQTQPRVFDVFVPWESPPGVAAGVLSAGLNDHRIGTVPVHFVVLPRSG